METQKQEEAQEEEEVDENDDTDEPVPPSFEKAKKKKTLSNTSVPIKGKSASPVKGK